MSEYGLVYLPPPVVKEYHLNLRQAIEERFHLTGSLKLNAPSHITLKYRFEAHNNINEVEEILADFSNIQTKTGWSISGFNSFQSPDNFVIFMDVIPTEQMRAAHLRLSSMLNEIIWMTWKPFDFPHLHYHMTLAHKGLHQDNFNAVYQYVQTFTPPLFELSFDNVTLLKIEEGYHHIYKRFDL